MPRPLKDQSGVEEFVAWVPYDGDWVGTVCAEDLDSAKLRPWLVNQKMVKEEDVLCGIRVYQGRVSVYVYECRDKQPYYEALQGPDPIPLKEIDLKISVSDLLCKFHMLEILFTRRSGADKEGLNNKRVVIEGRQ